jgi:hypothetical protein
MANAAPGELMKDAPLAAGNAKASSGDGFKRGIEVVTALATIVAAGSLVVAVLTYRDQEKSARLQRTLDLFKALNVEEPDNDRKMILTAFPDRWQKNMTPLAPDVAETFIDAARHPDQDQGVYERWNTARKHLNRLEEVAFAYVFDFVEPEILAASACSTLVRSNQYFKALIEVFRREYGDRHSWQLIPQAAALMESRYGPECKNLQSPIAGSKAVTESDPRPPKSDAASWIDRSLTIVAMIGGVYGWIATVRFNRGASRSQYTFDVMQTAALDTAYQAHLGAVRPFILTNDGDGLPNLNDEKNSALRGSVIFLLNYYEFVAGAVRYGVLAEGLLRDDQGLILKHLFSHTKDLIESARQKPGRQKLFEQVEWLYDRWFLRRPPRSQRFIEWLMTKPRYHAS